MGRKKAGGQQPLIGVRFTPTERIDLDAIAARLAAPMGKRPNRADALRFGLQLAKKGFAIPLLGDLGAGRPRDDPAEATDRLPVTQLFPTDAVAYRVRGDSMRDDLIASGDYVVVVPDRIGHAGLVVAWLKDGGGVLKNYDPIKHQLESGSGKGRWVRKLVDGDMILGALVGVIRKL